MKSYYFQRSSPSKKQRSSLEGFAESIIEERLRINIWPSLLHGIAMIAACFTFFGVIGIYFTDAGSWQHLTSAVSINFGVTLGLLAFESIRRSYCLILNPLTGMLLMYGVRRLMSLIFVLSERSEFMQDFLLVIGQFEYFYASSKAEIICALGTIAFWFGWRLFNKSLRHYTSFKNLPGVSDKQLWGVYTIGITVYFLELFIGAEIRSLGTLVITTKLLALGAIFTLLTFSPRFGIGSARVWVTLIAILPLATDAFTRGMKSAFFEFLLPIVLAYLIRKPRKGILLVGIGLIFLITFVYPYTMEYRDRVWTKQEEVTVGTIIRDTIREIKMYGILPSVQKSMKSFQQRLGGIGVPGVIIHVADRYGQLGPEFLENLPYAFIPRAIWPSKPVFEPANWFTWYLGWAPSPEEARTATALHIGPELYWMFGWIGVPIGMFLLGLMYRKINRFLLARSIQSSVMLSPWYIFLVSAIFIEELRYNSALITPIIIIINGLVIGWLISKFFPIPRLVQSIYPGQELKKHFF